MGGDVAVGRHRRSQQQKQNHPHLLPPPPPPPPPPLRRQQQQRRRRSNYYSSRSRLDNAFSFSSVPSIGLILCICIINGCLIYILIQLWFVGLVKVHENMIVKVDKQQPATAKTAANNNNNKSDILYSPSSPSSSLSELFHGHKFRKVPQQPIIVVGLPKAGTSSLFEYFNCNGYYTQHWYCCKKQIHASRPGGSHPTYMSECMIWNLHNGLPILTGCGDYDVYTEINGPRPPTTTTTNNNNNNNKQISTTSREGGGQSPPGEPQEQEQEKEESKEGRNLEGGEQFQTQQQQQQHQYTSRQKRYPEDGIFLPQHYHLQEIHDYSPNSIWILNIRPVHDWIDSVLSIDGQTLLRSLIVEVQSHFYNSNNNNNNNNNNNTSTTSSAFEDIDMTTFPATKYQKTPKGRKESRRFLQQFWDHHIRLIQNFVAKHPTHQLITVNISDPNAGIQLSESLEGIWQQQQQQQKTQRQTQTRQGGINNNNNNNNNKKQLSKGCWGHHNARDKKIDLI